MDLQRSFLFVSARMGKPTKGSARVGERNGKGNEDGKKSVKSGGGGVKSGGDGGGGGKSGGGGGKSGGGGGKDVRFSSAVDDPRFHIMKEKRRRNKHTNAIEFDRFGAMFADKAFHSKAKVDQFGRPVRF